MARPSYILGIICWLLVSLAPAFSASAVGLPAIELSQVEIGKIDSCHQLTATLPVKQQCSGAAGQATATARSRSSKDDKFLVARIGAVLSLAPIGVQARLAPRPNLRFAKRRRAHFWQIYAASRRLRN
ncbi:MAG: hypothetical protein ACI89J_000793 [Hyphomicrobiaceae bacterium]|jgi:hypothetical protein